MSEDLKETRELSYIDIYSKSILGMEKSKYIQFLNGERPNIFEDQ